MTFKTPMEQQCWIAAYAAVVGKGRTRDTSNKIADDAVADMRNRVPTQWPESKSSSTASLI